MEQDALEATTEPQTNEIAKDTFSILQETGTAEIETKEPNNNSKGQLTGESTPQEDIINLSISMPKGTFTDKTLANLDALFERKRNLIEATFGIEDVSYTLTDERIIFAWFSRKINSEFSQPYTNFISKLCEMARWQKRVVIKVKDAGNPKYAFRCFLLRLYIIGDAYKNSRKVLLQNLSGTAHGRAVMARQVKKITNTINEQILAIRATGLTNRYDMLMRFSGLPLSGTATSWSAILRNIVMSSGSSL